MLINASVYKPWLTWFLLNDSSVFLQKKKLTFQMPADRACELNQQNTDMTLQNKFKETIRFVF
jgi:hypothetical protein